MPFYRAPWDQAEDSTVPGKGKELVGEVRALRLHALLTEPEKVGTQPARAVSASWACSSRYAKSGATEGRAAAPGLRPRRCRVN